MNNPFLLDHLVYVAPTLEQGIQEIKEMIGIGPIYGGKHLNQGTHNALLRIGEKSYLEVLAIDPKNNVVPPPRWMGVDLIKDKGRFTRIGLKSDNLEVDVALLAPYGKAYQNIVKGSRKTADGQFLKWKMTLPLPTPLVDPVPFLVEWGNAVHPTDNMPWEVKVKEIKVGVGNHRPLVGLFEKVEGVNGYNMDREIVASFS